MPMHNPPHPGGIVKDQCLEPLALSVTETADRLGVSRSALSSVLNERAAISPDMALRFEAAGWGKAEAWLGMQVAHDLWKAKQDAGTRKKVRRFAVPEPV